MTTASGKKRWLRNGLGACTLALVVFAAVVVIDGWRDFGRSAQGKRRTRMEHSPQWRDGHFENPEPLINDAVGMFSGMLDISEHASPIAALPMQRIDPTFFAQAPTSGLRITWFGHASSLVEIDGARVLTDPMWSERSSPVSWLGPRRWYEAPIALAGLPKIDAVVISHDHYDHLDRGTIEAMKSWDTKFIVPLGVGEHLAYWGVAEAKIVELDWWQEAQVGALTIACTPARHASGRQLFDKDATLWASYALLGNKHRVYFSGDTGLFSAMTEIGRRYGPFDITMIETGQYHRAWPDWHIGPEQAVTAHRALRGKALLPVHWGMLTLAYHGWTEPAERVLTAARQEDVAVLMPQPGQSVEVGEPLQLAQRWWPKLPWQSADQHPIVSSQVHGF
jgi:L-ascorbate metabolism protein UlaG (beta-lactamase superfamily)